MEQELDYHKIVYCRILEANYSALKAPPPTPYRALLAGWNQICYSIEKWKNQLVDLEKTHPDSQLKMNPSTWDFQYAPPGSKLNLTLLVVNLRILSNKFKKISIYRTTHGQQGEC